MPVTEIQSRRIICRNLLAGEVVDGLAYRPTGAEQAPRMSIFLRCSLLEYDPAELVRRYLADPLTGWSVGTYGAIAEFQYDPDEPACSSIWRPWPRRGSGDHTLLEGVQPFGLIDDTGHLLEMVLRSTAQRTTITELGPLTFDVGIAAPHVDMLVRLRPDDAESAAALHAGVGRPLFAADNPAGLAIARASPDFASWPRPWRALRSINRSRRRAGPSPEQETRTPTCCRKLLAQGRTYPPGIAAARRSAARGLSLYLADQGSDQSDSSDDMSGTCFSARRYEGPDRSSGFLQRRRRRRRRRPGYSCRGYSSTQAKTRQCVALLSPCFVSKLTSAVAAAPALASP